MDAFDFIVASGLNILLAQFLWLFGVEFLLLLNRAAQGAQLLTESVQILLPGRSPLIDSLEEEIGCGRSHSFIKIFALKLLEENVQQVKIAIAQVK